MQVYVPKVRSRAGETLTFANELYKALESAAPNVQNPSQKTLLCAAPGSADKLKPSPIIWPYKT